MLYEIINPSDPYTIEAPDLEIAACACVVLGHGKYTFNPMVGGEQDVPFFLFGNYDEWFKAKLGANLETVLERVSTTRRGELADCLDSILYGSFPQRTAFDTEHVGLPPEACIAARREYNKAKHGSLNDIAGYAHGMADQLRTTQQTDALAAPENASERPTAPPPFEPPSFEPPPVESMPVDPPAA